MSGFGENVDPCAAIRAILGSYPFSVGLLRELLQNSDDAGASTQTFVLDHRIHATNKLYSPRLASTQGPALLAYNDAVFKDEDWIALRNIHASSKRTDTSKIGKYGIGFRSVYHITDHPQILSGQFLAILDPHHYFDSSGGVKLELAECHDHLAAFDSCNLSGSVIRLPLRGAESLISSKVVESDEVSGLLHDFIENEIDVVLLFLEHVKAINIYEIDERGRKTCLAVSLITTAEEQTSISITTTKQSRREKKIWLMLKRSFNQEKAISLLKQRTASTNPAVALTLNKLQPNLSVAIPLGPVDVSGGLFTFLPLPMKTGFPGHIHALFALTQSRQNLRNGEDVGIVRGSNDSILIEWNRILFDHFIPTVWAELLQILTKRDDFKADIFQAWPPPQPKVTCGDSLVWQSFPANIFEKVVSAGLAIWPVYRYKGAIEFQDLSSVLVAPQDMDEEVIIALTRAGLQITNPPGYIVDLIKTWEQFRCHILTPAVTHGALLEHVKGLRGLAPAYVNIILDYLLSTRNINNIVELPLIPLVGGKTVALVMSKARTSSIHTLLEHSEYNVFKSCDDNAIALANLPTSTADILREDGPSHLNVELFSPDKVVEYLHRHPNHLGLDVSTIRDDAHTIKWLSTFWDWFSESTFKDALFPKLQPLPLLPCTSGLETAAEPVFCKKGVKPILVEGLTALGVNFLQSGLTLPAQGVLSTWGLLKKIDDVHVLLRVLSAGSHSNGLVYMDEAAAQLLLAHLEKRLPESCALHGPLDDELRTTLRSLPIFHILNYTDSPTHIPNGSIVRGVTSESLWGILPQVAGTVFLDIHNKRHLLSYLEPDHSETLTAVQLLSLALEHFQEQPQQLQASCLEYILDHRQSMPGYILKSLGETPFVYTLDGAIHAPEDVIDLHSSLRPLFAGGKTRLPRTSTKLEEHVIKTLSSLGLLQSSLTEAIITERVEFISRCRPGSDTTARKLLEVIKSSRFDCRTISWDEDVRWLPTSQGLLRPSECRAFTSSEDKLYLFDEVLSVLEKDVIVSSSLQKAFGWDRPVPIDVLTIQLEQVLANKRSHKLTVIIRELSKRPLSARDVIALKIITLDQPWIPESGHPKHLIATSQAVFSEPIREAGFFQISSVLSECEEACKFLGKMGCSEKPSSDAILKKLKALQDLPPTLETVAASLKLLKALPDPTDFRDDERNRILVPDVDLRLRPISQVCFNDIGDRVGLIPASDSWYRAHPSVDEDLSKSLGITRLGFKFAHLQTPEEEDMGEKVITTVCRALGQYTKRQFIPEFLANASDAKATVFEVLLNERCGPAKDLLSSELAKFYDCPSLLIFNNSTFSEKDFEGIRRTNVGGKTGETDTIGQFGLGVLTMFHVTELAIVISGNDVLFMNPSKEHLPFENRAYMRMSLSVMRELYPGHFAAIDGVFGFKLTDRSPFKGTIFMLPLRNASHYEDFEHVSQDRWTVARARKEILNKFKTIAADCLLFTGITKVSASSRSKTGVLKDEWSVQANRSKPSREKDFRLQKVTISHLPIPSQPKRTWQIATRSVALPTEYQSVSKRRPLVGLAASLDDNEDAETYHFFATLPLPIETSLPVHVTASFILSSDRRNIRFDEYDNLETKYNKWLLSDVVPPLYLFLLERLCKGGCIDNERYWPGNDPDEDSISRVVTKAFYSSHLGSSKRLVFGSYFYWESLPPQQAVLSMEEPKSVDKALDAIQPRKLVKLPPAVSERAVKDAGLHTVTPQYLGDLIHSDPTKLTSTMSSKAIGNIVSFLIKDDPQLVIGLEILPLQDCTFASFGTENDTAYYVWKEEYGDPIFPGNRLICSDFPGEKLINHGLNVLLLESKSIGVLIREHLLAGQEIRNANAQLVTWITSFWNTYPSLKMSVEDIDQFPLVPTKEDGHYVSLELCRGNGIVLSNTMEPTWLWGRLLQLGITVVQKKDLTKDLQIIFQEKKYPAFNLRKLLSAIQPCVATVVTRMSSLSGDEKDQFASWLRDKFSSDPPFINVARRLPIWPAASVNQELSLCAASEIKKRLPHRLTATAARFMKVLSSAEDNLKHLHVTPMPYSDLRSGLELPKILGAEDEETYKTFLDEWMMHLSTSDTQPVPVPNCNRVMKLSNTLYARDPLFVAGFGAGSPLFILESFRRLESALNGFGLQRQANLNMPTFAACASSLHNCEDRGDNLVVRAAVVFASYSQALPLHVGSNQRALWHTLDDLRFIPRKMNVSRQLQYLEHMPAVVSPNELVRQEFEPIAWTQKGFFDVQPDERVLIAYPELGLPAVSDVLAHLKILVTLRRYPTLLNDLTATYNWLNDNAEAAENDVVQDAHLLFLNVDDPGTDEWNWEPADRLAFGTHDVGDVCHVRKFLMPFEKLLLAASVVPVHQPSMADAPSSASDSDWLVNIRNDHNAMRKAGQLVDVVFVPSSGNGSESDLVAHRTFLAGCSSYFRDAFCGNFRESGPASAKDLVRIEVGSPHACVARVLEYIYTGNLVFPDTPDGDGGASSHLDDLLDMLELSQYWHIIRLFESVQREIANKRLVNPRNLKRIRQLADTHSARLLLDYCVEYEELNAEYIRKVGL